MFLSHYPLHIAIEQGKLKDRNQKEGIINMNQRKKGNVDDDSDKESYDSIEDALYGIGQKISIRIPGTTKVVTWDGNSPVEQFIANCIVDYIIPDYLDYSTLGNNRSIDTISLKIHAILSNMFLVQIIKDKLRFISGDVGFSEETIDYIRKQLQNAVEASTDVEDRIIEELQKHVYANIALIRVEQDAKDHENQCEN